MKFNQIEKQHWFLRLMARKTERAFDVVYDGFYDFCFRPPDTKKSNLKAVDQIRQRKK